MTIELKPCPFCGSEAADPDGNNHTWCSETSCGSDAYLSVEAWNRRPEPGKPESGVLADAVKVKPLEWVEQISGEWWIADRYRVETFDGGGFAARSKGPQSGAFQTLCIGVSFDEAKAAAQADYEQRIMSALTTPPQPETLQRRVEELEAEVTTYQGLLDAAIDDYNDSLKRCAELEAALKLSFRAINDWVVVYASDMCDDARVEETNLRIRDAGGTLAYVAEINAVLGPLLRALKSDPAPVPAPKPFTFADPAAQLQHERHRAESRRGERE